MNAVAPTAAVAHRRAVRPAAAKQARPVPYSSRWFIQRQLANADRYLEALVPFSEDEFGSTGAAPGPAHLRAANGLISEVRARLEADVTAFRKIGLAKARSGSTDSFEPMLRLKDSIYARTNEAERLVAFYRNIFEQRRGRFGGMLHPLDRIARDCYKAVWNGLGVARSIPAPSPFTYIEDGNGPATYRRGVKLSNLGRRPNPFPLVKVPQHRLQNPWTLGAVPHEVAHNLQSDLGMWTVVPRRISTIMKDKIPESAVDIWIRWHKESYADFAGLLLIGPAYIESLIDVVAKRAQAAASFNPDGVHPTPILRVPMNCRLLRRIGFAPEADMFETTWSEIYPANLRRTLPKEFGDSFDAACDLMIQAICFLPEPAYGGRALAEVVKFTRKDATLVEEAAIRLVKGETTGILPERFLISAARIAFRSGRVRADTVSRNFYSALGRA